MGPRSKFSALFARQHLVDSVRSWEFFHRNQFETNLAIEETHEVDNIAILHNFSSKNEIDEIGRHLVTVIEHEASISRINYHGFCSRLSDRSEESRLHARLDRSNSNHSVHNELCGHNRALTHFSPTYDRNYDA